MNTGLQDVWNLVWKLDFAARGHGRAALLDSYTAERRPVIKQVIETTHFMTRAMATPNKLAQTLRDAIIPMVSHLTPFQHAVSLALAAETAQINLRRLGASRGGTEANWAQYEQIRDSVIENLRESARVADEKARAASG